MKKVNDNTFRVSNDASQTRSFLLASCCLFGIFPACLLAWQLGGPFWLLMWPAFSLLIVGAGYLGAGCAVFGKQENGTRSITMTIVLLPYLAVNSLIWHSLRVLKKEVAWHQLTDDITIGRRLFDHESAHDFEVVIDLTCEFAESHQLRKVPHYISFPMLDGVGTSVDALVQLFAVLAQLPGRKYVHCAAGRGRTGTVAACLMLDRRQATDCESAIAAVKKCRPLVRLTQLQQATVRSFARVVTKPESTC